MPSNYPGDPSGVAPHSTPTIACPVDADPANAASVNTPLQQLADVAAYLQAHGALLDVANTFTAQQTLNGAAGDAAKVLVSAPAVTVRKLLWEFSVGGAGIKARLYLNSDGELEFTRNARWDPTAAKWLADDWDASWRWCSSLVVFTMTGLSEFAYGDTAHDLTQAANAWAAAAWVSVAAGKNGHLRFFDTIDGGTGNSNPGPAEEQKNVLRAKNTPKAWATVSVNAGAVTVIDGFNLEWDSNPAVDTIRFKFPSGGEMHDGNYAVFGNVEAGQAKLSAPMATRTTAGFDVKFPLHSLAGFIDISTIGLIYFDVLVFGRQDS